MAKYGMTLAKGQEALMAIDGKPVENIRLEVGWDPNKGIDMDIDSSILVYRKEEPSTQELIYYCKLSSDDGSIIHNGDNLTGEDDYFDGDDDEEDNYRGEDDGDGVDETIDVHLKEINGKYNRLAVVINIFGARIRKQTFASVENLFIRIRNMDDGSFICNYKVTDKIYDDNTVVIGLFLKKGTEWIFKALGASYDFAEIENFANMVAEHH